MNSFQNDLRPVHGGMLEETGWPGVGLSPFVKDTDKLALITCPLVPPKSVDPVWSFILLKLITSTHWTLLWCEYFIWYVFCRGKGDAN